MSSRLCCDYDYLPFTFQLHVKGTGGLDTVSSVVRSLEGKGFRELELSISKLGPERVTEDQSMTFDQDSRRQIYDG